MKTSTISNTRSSERKRQHRKQVEKENKSNNNDRKQVEKENKSNNDFTVQLDSKQRSLRENTLTSLVHFLSSNARHEFVDNNYVTLIHRCLHRLTFKKIGSSKFTKTEIRLTVRIISLVVINLVNEDKSSDVFHQCFPILANALVSLEYGVDVVLELIACLGMVGFFGSTSSMEVEKVMRVVWDFVHKSSSIGSVLTSTISTWSFLITVVNGNYLNKYWKECNSHLSSLLKREDFEENNCESVYLAVTDALTLMFDVDMFKKFSEKLETEEECVLLKEKIAGNFEGSLDDCREIIQVMTMKEFLGEESFASHLKTNENFHQWYESTMCDDEDNDDDNDNEYTPEREEIVLKFYRHEVERQKEDNDLLPYVSAAEKNLQKRMVKSPCSPLNKARTRLLTKQRKFVNQFPVESDLWV